MRLVLRLFVYVLCYVTPFAVAQYHAENYGFYDFGSRYSPWWIFLYGTAFALSAFVVGIPGLVERTGQAFVGSAIAAAMPFALASLFFLLVDPDVRSRLIVGGPALILFGVFVVVSLIHASMVRRSVLSDRVVVIADSSDVSDFERDLDRPPERKFTVKDVIDPSVIVQNPALLSERVAAANANLIVLSEASQASSEIVEQAALLHEEGIRIRGMSAFGDEWLGRVPVKELARTSLWFDIRDLHEGQYIRLKRLMDLTITVLVFPIFVLSLPVVLVGNIAGNRGPLFFRQQRVGQRNELFRIWKYRTMTPGSNADGAGKWTSMDDPRITSFGLLLRRTHLDELPQLLNVLVGELSIVGPRPEQLHYVEELSQTIPFYGLRHAVRPGVTGWAQVKYPYGASEEDALEKLQYELYYLRHQSLSLDLRICLRTVLTIVRGEGR